MDPSVDFRWGKGASKELPIAFSDLAEERQGGGGAIEFELACRDVDELNA